MASPAIPPGYKLVPDDQGGPPEGRGRAMALTTYLSRGGGLVKNRKGVEVYADGPMRGMTQAQAEADFENKWAGASGAVKDKYSRKAGPDGVLSPSEKEQYQTVATPAMPATNSLTDRRMGATPGSETVMENVPTPTPKPAINPAATPVGAAPTPSPAPIANINDLPTDERMRAQGKTNAGGVPVVKAPKQTALNRQFPGIEAKVATPSQAPIAAPKAPAGPKVNSLTGLPMGYNPGDVVAPQFADAAAASVARQRSVPATTPAMRTVPELDRSAINRPRTVTTGVEGAANREMKRQAGINANPSTVNPDDPKKFFTGRTLPLDQLVKRQTVSTPVRR
jgi:hypothetical protein